MVLLVLDLLGVAVFALAGALAAIRARLDVFGVVVLGIITALGGGVIRDVLLGITPPTTLRQWQYLAVASVVSAAACVPRATVPARSRLRKAILVADAFGLALFVTTGTAAALAVGAPPVAACLVGVISGIGGGVTRDVLLREIPLVLHRDIYALPAVAGAVLVTSGNALGWPSTPVLVAAAALIASVRLLAIWREWDAPRPRRR
ncbi:trimeric intracellular cation channel family protein [Pseudonocardia acaciae]|uniref:trimeric intracellular cation channel family protein n=1 Tax=Pseudonocardia acaciae TaxID=551276 RepID=UPI00048C9D35|nr:TRIC cation channel family protein [Pseudonocardia acaciae]